MLKATLLRTFLVNQSTLTVGFGVMNRVYNTFFEIMKADVNQDGNNVDCVKISFGLDLNLDSWKVCIPVFFYLF